MTKHAQRLSEYFFIRLITHFLASRFLSLREKREEERKKKKQTVLKLFKDLTSFILQLGDVHRDSNLKD